MAHGVSWTCPHCSKPQIKTGDQVYETSRHIDITYHKYRQAGLHFQAIGCVNPDCGEITLKAQLTSGVLNPRGGYEPKKTIDSFQLRPAYMAIQQPDYVPQPIRDSYLEACKIKHLSPGASATLARRCLQGMIRDFCGISRNTLDQEIRDLSKMVEEDKAPRGVEPESVNAIDKVRRIGNIGAHMESDINVIVEVDPDEAQTLIELIEALIQEWYVARHNRAQRFKKIDAIADDKAEQKKLPPPGVIPEASEL